VSRREPRVSALDAHETALRALDEATRDADGLTVDANLDELGRGGLPLRTAGTGVGAGHLPLRNCHDRPLDRSETWLRQDEPRPGERPYFASCYGRVGTTGKSRAVPRADVTPEERHVPAPAGKDR